MSRRNLTLMAVGLVVSIASCGDGGEEAVSSSIAPATSATTAESQPEPTSGPFPEGEPLDLVLLADSAGWGVAERYAVKAAKALGSEIRVHDRSTGGATALNILAAVQNEYGAADDVADAEIIVFHVHPGRFEPAAFMPCLEWLGGETLDDPPEATSVEDWQGYRDTLDQIYDEIWRLRAGQPTIVRAYGVYAPWLGQWQQMGIDSACMAGEEAVDQAREESAEDHGAVFVSMLDVFTGPRHDQDPVARGWIAEDGMHLSEDGVALLVDTLASVGFEPSVPPS